MSVRAGLLWCIPAGAALACAAVLNGQQANPRPQDLPPQTERNARVWRLVWRCEDERYDVTGLAEELPHVSETQKRQINALAQQYQADRERLLNKLRDDYADKVRRVLSGEQRKRYDGLLDALDKLAAGLADARGKFLKDVGADGERSARTTDYGIPLGDPTSFLDLSEEKRATLQKLRGRMHRSLAAALRDMPDARSLDDYRNTRERTEAEFEEQRRAALSPEEVAQLEKVEEAAARYRQRMQELQEQASGTIQSLLEGGPPD